MIKEVSRFSDLPASNDPDLEVGDVYRVTGEVLPGDGRLNPSGTVLKWDGRAWVPLNGVEPVQNESGGKKDVRVDDGVPPNDVHHHLPDINNLCVCGVQLRYVDDREVTEISAGFPATVVRRMKRHDIQALDADSDVISRWMPRDLVTWYVALCGRITGPSGPGMDDTVIPGTGKPYGGLGSLISSSSSSLKPDSGKRGQKSSVLMRSEWASLLKERTDRKLRKIARELKNALDEDDELRMDAASKGVGGKDGVGGKNGRSATRRRCSGRCGKFGESDWLYCARCGGPMNEVD